MGWHAEPEDVLADDIAALKDLLSEAERSIYGVIDLDTGEEVDFERTVSVTIAA